jgi:transposase
MMSAVPTPTPSEMDQGLLAQVVRLQAELVEKQAVVEQLTRERDQLRQAYEQLRLELELLKRRIFVAKAERVDTAKLEAEFAGKLAALDQMGDKLQQVLDQTPPPPHKPKGNKPTGRRDLRKATLPEQRIELPDPKMEALCQSGQAERIGFEESCKLAWQRGGHVRLVVARVKYRQLEQVPQTTTTTTPIPTAPPPPLSTAPMPKETLSRCLAAPSLLAHILVDKYCDGLPLHRIQDRFARDGVPLDRGTMSRWAEEAGATFGATVVAAARKEALSTALCLATDATGICVQPIPTGKRQPCRRGHFFVQIADQDHVFFEYTPKETSKVVGEMFRGFSGYVQADAKSVYDLLFTPLAERQKKLPDDGALDLGERQEVGCWSHARRRFWEAATAKSEVAREGLVRIGRLFDLEDKWRGRAPEQIHRLRNEFLRPHLDAFFDWATGEYDKVRTQRGLLRSALGYALRQRAALVRLLDDGRLVMDNNRSERQLRRVAVGRKAWLFCGSDDHATAAGHILSLIASARLHGLDPEAYLRDLFRVLAHWPRDRYLELAPKYWVHTRARLDPAQLLAEIGPLTIPQPQASSTEEQTTSR